MVSINRRTNCSNQQLFKCTYSPVSKTKLRTCELILLVFLFSLLHILRGGQVPNYANAKQSATKILFKHQLQSVPSLNKKKKQKYFQFTCMPYKLSECLSCGLIESAVASGCQLQRVCDYSDHFHNDGPWMCCHSGTFN